MCKLVAKTPISCFYGRQDEQFTFCGGSASKFWLKPELMKIHFTDMWVF